MNTPQTENIENNSARTTDQDPLNISQRLITESVDGSLITRSSRYKQNSMASTVLKNRHNLPFGYFGDEGPDGWLIQIEPPFNFGEDILIPDMAGWRIEPIPQDETGTKFRLAFDWVCGVKSDSTQNYGICTKKAAYYAKVGVGYFWILDPQTCSLEVFQFKNRSKWESIDKLSDVEQVSPKPFKKSSFDLKEFCSPYVSQLR